MADLSSICSNDMAGAPPDDDDTSTAAPDSSKDRDSEGSGSNTVARPMRVPAGVAVTGQRKRGWTTGRAKVGRGSEAVRLRGTSQLRGRGEEEVGGGGVRGLVRQFERIMEESDESMAGAPEMKSLEERTGWWEWRLQLDVRLRGLLRYCGGSQGMGRGWGRG